MGQDGHTFPFQVISFTNLSTVDFFIGRYVSDERESEDRECIIWRFIMQCRNEWSSRPSPMERFPHRHSIPSFFTIILGFMMGLIGYYRRFTIREGRKDEGRGMELQLKKSIIDK